MSHIPKIDRIHDDGSREPMRLLPLERVARLHEVIAHLLAHGQHEQWDCTICDDGRALVDVWLEAAPEERR